MHAGEQLGLDDGSLAGRVGLVRALVLIGVALVIGGLLVFRGLDSGSDTVAAGSDTSTLAGGEADEGSVDDVGATPGSTPDEGADGEASPAALSTASTASATTEATVSEAATSTTAAGAASTTATTVAPVTTAASGDAASTTVLVLNAASGKGVAAAGAQILKDAGYTVMAPKNANGPSKSKILYTKGNEAAAEAVAAVFDVDPATVVGPFDPAKSPIATIGDADVIVVIGTDGVIKTS
ncbi:MAG: LytR C-terminal domain-containing protein [Acidimicrobiales bacterium]